MRWHQSTIMGPVELAVVTSLARPGTRNGLEKEYADAAPRYCLPAMHELEYGARIGGLVSDGPDFGDVFRRAGRDVGRILKGGKPAEMAIEEPRKCHPSPTWRRRGRSASRCGRACRCWPTRWSSRGGGRGRWPVARG